MNHLTKRSRSTEEAKILSKRQEYAKQRADAIRRYKQLKRFENKSREQRLYAYAINYRNEAQLVKTVFGL